MPQATVPGKRDSSSVAAVWLSYFFYCLARRSTIIRLLNQNPFHASANTTFLRKVTFFFCVLSYCPIEVSLSDVGQIVIYILMYRNKTLAGSTRQGASGARTLCCHCCEVGCPGEGLLLAVRSACKTCANWAVADRSILRDSILGDRSRVPIYATSHSRARVYRHRCNNSSRDASPFCSCCEQAVSSRPSSERRAARLLTNHGQSLGHCLWYPDPGHRCS